VIRLRSRARILGFQLPSPHHPIDAPGVAWGTSSETEEFTPVVN